MTEVVLRDVEESDLPVLFEHQLDEEATRMAAFAARDREAFMTHWTRILGDDVVGKQTIVAGDTVAGSLVSWDQNGKREIGYWLGRDFWGRGIATRALGEFVRREGERPLYAYVARHNVGSIRVLEKCGFVREADARWENPDGTVVDGIVFELRPD